MKKTQAQVDAACVAALEAHNRIAPARVLGVHPVLREDRIAGLVFTYHEHAVSAACLPMDDAPRQSGWFAFFKRIPLGSEIGSPDETISLSAAFTSPENKGTCMNPNDRPDPRDNPEYWRTDSEGHALYLAEKKAGAHRSKVKHRVVVTVGLILALGVAIAFWFANRR